MVRNFHSLLALFFGTHSQMAQVITSWAKHIVRWELIYESQQNDDPSFITQVLFSIDAMVKTYLVSCFLHIMEIVFPPL